MVPGSLIDQSIEDVKHNFDTNVFGVWRMAKAVIPEMAKRRSGVIVNIGSVAGEVYIIFKLIKSVPFHLSEFPVPQHGTGSTAQAKRPCIPSVK